MMTLCKYIDISPEEIAEEMAGDGEAFVDFIEALATHSGALLEELEENSHRFSDQPAIAAFLQSLVDKIESD